MIPIAKPYLTEDEAMAAMAATVVAMKVKFGRRSG